MKPVTMEFLWETIDEGKRVISAKDAEIASLSAALGRADADAARIKEERMNAVRALWPAERERDEARKCAARLWRALDAVRGAGMETCMVERDGHDDQVEAVTAALEALAATPEVFR